MSSPAINGRLPRSLHCPRRDAHRLRFTRQIVFWLGRCPPSSAADFFLADWSTPEINNIPNTTPTRKPVDPCHRTLLLRKRTHAVRVGLNVIQNDHSTRIRKGFKILTKGQLRSMNLKAANPLELRSLVVTKILRSQPQPILLHQVSIQLIPKQASRIGQLAGDLVRTHVENLGDLCEIKLMRVIQQKTGAVALRDVSKTQLQAPTFLTRATPPPQVFQDDHPKAGVGSLVRFTSFSLASTQ